MSYQNIFKRYEIKYLITKEQKNLLLAVMTGLMEPDKFYKSSIRNLYYDTPDFLLVRRSLEKPVYKEKLRVRSYGEARPDSEVFVELKKKYDGIVYKRRIAVPEKEAMDYLNGTGKLHLQSQITDELDYFKTCYRELAPKVYLSYDREAYCGILDRELRITFDEKVLWRETEVTLEKGVYGSEILPPNMVLMEVKTAGALPLWLCRFLSEHQIYKTGFSKYGRAYEMKKEQENYGGEKYA